MASLYDFCWIWKQWCQWSETVCKNKCTAHNSTQASLLWDVCKKLSYRLHSFVESNTLSVMEYLYWYLLDGGDAVALICQYSWFVTHTSTQYTHTTTHTHTHTYGQAYSPTHEHTVRHALSKAKTLTMLIQVVLYCQRLPCFGWTLKKVFEGLGVITWIWFVEFTWFIRLLYICKVPSQKLLRPSDLVGFGRIWSE